MPCPCRAHSVPLPSHAAEDIECLSHLIYTVRPCLIQTCHAHAMIQPCRSSQGHNTAVSRLPCCAVALRRTAWSEHGMASVNQTRPHPVNQMGKTHSKPLAARHGRGTAWARHAMCESALRRHFSKSLKISIYINVYVGP